jgi:hypothetical protein
MRLPISALGLLNPKRACKFVCSGTLIVIAAYAQSDRSTARNRPTTFHVEGTIRRGDSGVAGVEVKFEAKDPTKAVFSNQSGFYKAELPFGFYTMAASQGSDQKYRRRFLVTSRRIVVLDVVLYDDPDCDPVFPRLAHSDGTPISPEPTQDDYRDVCGGSDLVSIQPEAGEPFELLVRYSNRRRSDAEITYTSYGGRGPVFAAYNLFTLSADRVVYNAADRTITASGGVVTRDAVRKTKHFDSAIFKIENGEVSVHQ